MVNAVHLRTLEEVANPLGRANTRVVKKFTERCARRIDGAGLYGQAQKSVNECAADERIYYHLTGMFVERGDQLDPLGAVMDLVEQAPQHIILVAPPVSTAI